MNFNVFVIPFNIGLYFILLYTVARSVIWFHELSRQDKLRLQRGFFGMPFVQSIKEIFLESLIHRKILKTNPRLGYMHMSLAFGWFLLILFGTIEADIFGAHHLNPPYKAIFFRYFNPEHGRTPFEEAFGFLMDFTLAFILSGLLLAVTKRFWSGVVGMKKTTRLTLKDKIALTSLWLIFPSRLIAESFTSGAYGTGSFLTGTLGNWLASFLPAAELAYPFWWLYSLSLGTFFVLLPLTRYMHIPTELFLIFMRNSGIRTGHKAGTFSEVQTFSCSSCGICIDTCQMNTSLGINNIQSAYLLKAIRNDLEISEIADNCLLCGRCEAKCPVGIELSPIRMIQRRRADEENRITNLYGGYLRKQVVVESVQVQNKEIYDYLPAIDQEKTDVIFFAGCMTHLSPSIKNAMIRILETSGIGYRFIDEEGGVCCGRPLMLAGKDREARELINFNSEMMTKTGAKILVTSCPICYKVFRESYHLGMEVLHHSQFIKRLIDDGLVKLSFLHKSVVYHSPCELGRGSGVYDEPKEVLKHVSRLEKSKYEDQNSLCCGGSLANLKIDHRKKMIIAKNAVEELTINNPDVLATACPLCKKTFAPVTNVKVLDIAEIVAEAINNSKPETKLIKTKKIPAVSVNRVLEGI
jgi:Fe-S oxidoreductase